MITLLTGDNTFAISDTLSQLLRDAREKLGEHGVTVIDSSDVSVPDLPQLLQGTSLFADDRVIVIRDAPANKQVWERLEEVLPNVSATTSVILVAPTIDKRTRTYKWLQKNAVVREARDLNEVELVKWLQERARAINVEIKPNDARYLIEYIGLDQWRLRQELEKLMLSEQPITQELIRELIEPNPQANAFQLLDAVMAGRKAEAERLLTIAQSSEDPYRFVGLLANQIYALLLCVHAGNRDAATIARDSGVHPFVIKKLLPIARKMSAVQSSKLIDILSDLDRQLKSTGTDPWTLIRVALNSIQV